MGKVGGHCNTTNLDVGALRTILSAFTVKSMVDVGCGPGEMVFVARKYFGLDTYGIDGDPKVYPDVLHNFDDGPLIVEPFDLAWSVEFLEHIEEQYLDNVFSVFKQARYVFCTHNPTPGPWHFNCRPNEYWVEVFSSHSFDYDSGITAAIKRSSTMVREFVKETGTFFVNTAQHHR